MIESRREVWPAVAELTGDLLDLGPRRHENGHAPTLPHDAFYETIVQKLERLLGEHVDLSCFCRIERARFQDLGGSQIVRVESWIDCG